MASRQIGHLGEPAFEEPDFGDTRRVRIGSSVIEEFVAGHDAGDVLRELVQNEFDGGGDKLALTFGSDALEVAGSGRGIPPDGWSRLSVIVGTGEVMGSDEVVAAKVNGIGSKNFGLRSLFLFGDSIYVMSRGRVALLDLVTKETAHGRQRSSAENSVRLHVPYRRDSTKRLEAFTDERENHAFARMGESIADTLVKLALAGRSSGLREVSVRSLRTGRSILWRQRAETERSRIPGISIITRSGKLSIDKGKATSFDEIEFARNFDLPPEHAERDFPAYYKVTGGRLRIAVSLPIVRRRLDADCQGHFYYPLKAPASRTGCAVSVSAPFELNNDRSNINDNGWNDWLIDRAADLVFDLLRSDWVDRFGAGAYRALSTRDEAKPDRFAAAIRRRLSEDSCWATRGLGSERFTEATNAVIPAIPELDGFLSDENYLDPALVRDERVATLAIASGAKEFTLSSLVRLRCGPQVATGLATQLKSHEAAYWFESFESALKKVERQVEMARVLSAFRRNLTKDNRSDLASSASTLNALGALRPARDLIAVGADIWDGCPEPMQNRLHPALAEYSALAGHCIEFDEEKWLIDAARRSATASDDDPEREILYRKLLSDAGPIKRGALSALRENPVVRNQRGEWTAPADMVALKRPLARLFDPVVDAPSPQMLQAQGLIARLRIRDTLSGSDIVRLAAALPNEADAAARFERLLSDNLKLLSGSVVSKLRDIPCLMSRSGTLTRPAELHVDTPTNRQCIDDARIVGPGSDLVHRRLKLLETPDSDTLLEMIGELREADRAPSRPDLLYDALVRAIMRERRSRGEVADLPICWVMGDYRAPKEILTGSRIPSLFAFAIPVYRHNDDLSRAYADLGAPTVATADHWARFFRHVGSVWSAEPMSDLRRRTLLEAYQLRGSEGLPEGVDDAACLLDDRNRLFSYADLRRGLLVEPDFPALQQALSDAGSSVGVVARSDRSRNFFAALGIRPVSSIAQTGKPLFGANARPHIWYQPKHRDRLLAMLHRPLFARALYEVAYGQRFSLAGFEPTDLGAIRERLAGLSDVAFFATIERRYEVAGIQVAVGTEVAIGEGIVGLVPPKTKQQFQFLLAEALAELAGATSAAATRALANALLPLVLCATPDDLRSYLARIGIEHSRWSDEDGSAAHDESEGEALEQEIVRQLFDTLDIDGEYRREPESTNPDEPPVPQPPMPPPPPPSPLPPTPPPFVLPDLNSVELKIADPNGTEIERRPTSSGGSGGGSSSGWLFRTAAEMDRDEKVGKRGEELVYRQEIERVRSMGHPEPETVVVWTSRFDSGADHDIRSIDEKGRTKWLEVKATIGTDGRFDWSRKEFEMAMRERDRYELWRVYLAASTAPIAKCFRNPARMLGSRQIALEIGGLRANIEGVS